MRFSTLAAGLAAVVSVSADGTPAGIAPSSSPPDGCVETAKSNFTIGYTLLSSIKRESAIDAGNSALECNLTKGILTDPQGRIGSVVANYQLQFDGPPAQAGAIYTGGFSVCQNSSLAIGGTTRWWKCGSGDFYNLYDRSIGAQCDEIRIVVTYEQSTSSSSSSAGSSSTATSSGSMSTSTGASTTSGSSKSSNGTASATATNASGSGSASSSGSSASSTGSGSTAGASGSSGAAPAPTANAADSIRIAGAETLGAVIGIFGAALLL